MNIELATEITDLDGNVLEKDGSKEGSPKEKLTLGLVAVTALVTPVQSEQHLPAEERFKRGELAQRIYGKPSADLKAEEVVMIKSVIGKLYSPLIVFRAWTLLDPPPAEE